MRGSRHRRGAGCLAAERTEAALHRGWERQDRQQAGLGRRRDARRSARLRPITAVNARLDAPRHRGSRTAGGDRFLARALNTNTASEDMLADVGQYEIVRDGHHAIKTRLAKLAHSISVVCVGTRCHQTCGAFGGGQFASAARRAWPCSAPSAPQDNPASKRAAARRAIRSAASTVRRPQPGGNWTPWLAPIGLPKSLPARQRRLRAPRSNKARGRVQQRARRQCQGVRCAFPAESFEPPRRPRLRPESQGHCYLIGLVVRDCIGRRRRRMLSPAGRDRPGHVRSGGGDARGSRGDVRAKATSGRVLDAGDELLRPLSDKVVAVARRGRVSMRVAVSVPDPARSRQMPACQRPRRDGEGRALFALPTHGEAARPPSSRVRRSRPLPPSWLIS